MSAPMSVFDGGVDFGDGEETFAGGLLVITRCEYLRNEQHAAEDSRVAKKPPTIMTEILARSGPGRDGASGSMTRFGTKKTASQRVRKATAGVKIRAVALSTNLERRSRRRREMVVIRDSMVKSGAGKAMEREASKLAASF